MHVLTIAILAGGRSSRMGVDKALTPVAGIPMLQRIAQTARDVSPHLLILGRNTAPPNWPHALPATFVPDATRTPTGDPAGPMPALLAALERTRTAILLLACDMPLLTAKTLHQLLAAHDAAQPRATLALSRNPDGTTYAEPTLALYTPAIIPALQRLLVERKGAFQPLLREESVIGWAVPQESEHELLNVNTPEALAEAETFLKQRTTG